MKRILVCGGREYDDWGDLDHHLEKYTCPGDIIIQGGAKGADFLAKVWAKYNRRDSIEYKADWNKYGKAAGAMRNVQMLTEGKPHIVIAFPGGSGTKNMIILAKQAGVPVIEIN